MEKEIIKVLKRWEKSLKRYGKLNEWSRNEDFSVLGNYLRNKQRSSTERELIRQVRDKAACLSFDSASLLSVTRKAIRIFEPINEETICTIRANADYVVLKNGQEARFRHETERIFGERLRFKSGMLLRNFDIETERSRDSKKVRRIVEKRMCQAYHRMHKRQHDDSNRDRYWKHRATAFQLYNIGQIENVNNVTRKASSHWKVMYDPCTGGMVFKKKMSYNTEQEALDAIFVWKLIHPTDPVEMHAYQCETCHKWHKGHDPRAKYRQEHCDVKIVC